MHITNHPATRFSISEWLKPKPPKHKAMPNIPIFSKNACGIGWSKWCYTKDDERLNKALGFPYEPVKEE
jgi:hypothetical protein